MGIKNFHKFMMMYAPHTFKTKTLFDYRGQILAVDANLILYDMLGKCIGYNCRTEKTGYDHFYDQLSDMLVCARKFDIKLIFVFDGETPDIKKEKVMERRKQKEKAKDLVITDDMSMDEKRKIMFATMHLTRELREGARRTLRMNSIDIIDAPYEADSQCAKLSRNGIVDGVITTDFDILTFGGRKIITDMFKFEQHYGRKYVTEISIDDILKNLKLSFDSFVDLCILMGTDYSERTGLRFEQCYDMITKHKTIESIDEPLVSLDKIDYIGIRKYFSECCGIDFIFSERKDVTLSDLCQMRFGSFF